MTKKQALDYLIAHAVCSTELLYCDEHCPLYIADGEIDGNGQIEIKCKPYTDKNLYDAVILLKDLKI